MSNILDDDQGDQKLNKLTDQKLVDHPTLLNEVSKTQSNSKKYQVGRNFSFTIRCLLANVYIPTADYFSGVSTFSVRNSFRISVRIYEGFLLITVLFNDRVSLKFTSLLTKYKWISNMEVLR